MNRYKRIGIIGGLSPESTVSYYLHITRSYVRRFGDCGYPEIIIYSVNFENYNTWREQDRWDLIAEDLVSAARNLQSAGADFGLIATNTMHKVFDEVQQAVELTLIHLIDATVLQIREKGITTVGLLGTSHTMSDGFYTDRLERNGLVPLVPDFQDRETIHRIIVDELVKGIFLDESRQQYLEIIRKLEARGAEGIILGCTEIPLLVRQQDCSIPLFDTAEIHAEVALQRAIAGQNCEL